MGFSLGGFVNSITGASNSASQANKYAVGNAALNHKYQKEFAQNAHQWEVEDLKKAGLNPALSAGGGGASASGGGSFGGQTGTPGANPLDIVGKIADIRNGITATNANNKMLEEQANYYKSLAGKTNEETGTEESGWFGRMFGSKAGKAIVNKIEKGNNPNAAKKSKKQNGWDRLTTFEIRKTR